MKKMFYVGGALAVLSAVVVGLSGSSGEAANITFIGRGVVKSGGAADSINVYWTHVPASVERIAGVRADVSTSSAKIYKWEKGSDGDLVKNLTTSLPVPEREVVIRGVLKDDDRVIASWIVQNYRQFEIEGKLQARTLDTGKTDEGWLTVEVSRAEMRGIVPARKFKETKLKGTDLRIRVNGKTAITALGKSKILDEVTAGQQKVIFEGEVLNEDAWIASKVKEFDT